MVMKLSSWNGDITYRLELCGVMELEISYRK